MFCTKSCSVGAGNDVPRIMFTQIDSPVHVEFGNFWAGGRIIGLISRICEIAPKVLFFYSAYTDELEETFPKLFYESKLICAYYLLFWRAAPLAVM